MAEYNVHIKTPEDLLALPTWGGALTLDPADRTTAIWTSATDSVNVYFDNDIDLNGYDLETWRWTGTYTLIDGQNHKIKNIGITNHMYQSLIYITVDYNFIDNHYAIQNLFFDNVNYTSTIAFTFIYFAIAAIRDNMPSQPLVYNITIKGRLSLSGTDNYIIYADRANNYSYFSFYVSHCAFIVDLVLNSNSNLTLINITGWGRGALINNSYFVGSVLAQNNNTTFYGFCQMNNTRSSISNCFFNGTLKGISAFYTHNDCSVNTVYYYISNPEEWKASVSTTFPLTLNIPSKDIYFVQENNELFTNCKSLTLEQIKDKEYLKTLGWAI